MFNFALISAVVLLGMVCLGLVVWLVLRKNASANNRDCYLPQSIEFQEQKEGLEASFFAMASESGKPRGLAWSNCEFDEEATFAIHTPTRHLRALVGAEISFTAIEGGGMEDNPNVGNVRAATAVFEHDGQEWTTLGRAVFNLEPLEAIKHFESELELIEPGNRSAG